MWICGHFVGGKLRESSLIPMLHHLKDTALKMEKEDANMTRVIKNEILAQLDTKYDNDKTMQLMCTDFFTTLLDPRYKGDYVAPAQLDYIKTKLQVEMAEFWSNKRAGPVGPAVCIRVEDEDEEGEEEAPPQPVKKAKSLGGLVKPPIRRTPEQRAETEMDSYLSEEVIDGDDDPPVHH